MNMTDNTEGWTSLGVPSIITKALLEENFYSPTTIQMLAIPPAILGHRDILGAAETGSGKTLAFGIPIIAGILELKKKMGKIITSSSGNFRETNKDEIISRNDKNNFNVDEFGIENVFDNIQCDYQNVSKTLNPLYALILTPTRELATQIKNHLSKAAKFTDIKIAVIVGGLALVKQERILSKGPEIVIATPGRLWELINEGNSHLSQIDLIRYLVIDETDRMLERGHFLELHKIIERINSKTSEDVQCQKFMFSATLTFTYDIPKHLQRKKFKNSKNKISNNKLDDKLQKMIKILGIQHPKIIDITQGPAINLTECRIICTLDYKDYYLYYFLKKYPGRTIVFCNSIGSVRRLVTLFGILDCKPLPLHANMLQRQRLKNLEKFQANNNGLLVATDVAARGLDIPCIEHVIHYHVPKTSESYIHRSGRTARAEKNGITILMMEPSEKQFYRKLCKTLNRTEDLPIFPVSDNLLEAIKERINIAREIDKLELACRKNNFQKGWLEKAAKEMDILLDDDELKNTMDVEEMSDVKQSLKIKRKYLSNLMEKPIFPKRISENYTDKNKLINQNSHKAVDLMKKVIDENLNTKKLSNKVLNGKKELLN